MQQEDKMHTVAVAAERLGLKPETIRAWIARRKIGIVRLGRSVRVRESELQRLIDAGSVPAKI